MYFDMTGIDHQPLEIRLLYHRFQHFFPDALVSPATETPLDSIPLTIFRRQVSPWCSRSQNPEHAIQKLTGILCVPSPRSLVSYCVRLENFPHRIGHIVPSIAVLHEETPLCVFLHYTTKRHFCRQCLKTLASKHKTSLSKIIDKFNDGTGKWGIPYETKLGSKRRYFANYADCKGKAFATDYISNAAVVYGYAVNTLENRLKAKVCELCGTTESDHYEVHHINKLKNLKGKERWEIAMIAKHRKTLVVCRDCHRSIIHKK